MFMRIMDTIGNGCYHQEDVKNCPRIIRQSEAIDKHQFEITGNPDKPLDDGILQKGEYT